MIENPKLNETGTKADRQTYRQTDSQTDTFEPVKEKAAHPRLRKQAEKIKKNRIHCSTPDIRTQITTDRYQATKCYYQSCLLLLCTYEASRRCASKSFGSKKEVFVCFFLKKRAQPQRAVTVFFVYLCENKRSSLKYRVAS